ncbi:MAG: bifunctional 4-hydroxy-2-oxoglutarate aldolase/2-dehydro-3-deoxy-phosphogluconate aldolase [Opitutales bacterium]
MKRIVQARLVPVAVIDRVEDAVRLAETLISNGVDILEVTFRTPVAPESIRAVLKAFPDMLVGAGTLLDVYQVDQAVEAGAKFGVAPGVNRSVVQKAQVVDLTFVPGVMTPSDVEKALSLGCQLLKFFPAETAGGIKMLKAISAPYAHTGVKFIPLGGVNASNAADYLALPIVAAIGGSWFVDQKLIAAGDWDRIGELTREAVALTQSQEE